MTKIKVFFTYTSIRIFGLEHNQSTHRLLSNLKDLVLFNSYKILLICAQNLIKAIVHHLLIFKVRYYNDK